MRLLTIMYCTCARTAARSSCALSVHIRHARLPTSKKSLVKPLRRNKKGSPPQTLTGRESERAVVFGTIASFTNSPSRFQLKSSPPELKSQGADRFLGLFFLRIRDHQSVILLGPQAAPHSRAISEPTTAPTAGRLACSPAMR